MDDRDRNPSSGSSGRYSRRRRPDDEQEASPPVRRRSRQDEGQEPSRSRPDDRRYGSDREQRRTPRESGAQPTREPGQYRPASREEQSTRGWSADRFRRARRDELDEADDRSPISSRDPYDRLRRVGNRPPRRVEVDPYDEPDFADLDE